MKLSIYQIDTFAEQLFEGNPAAVVPLKSWLPDSIMQSIAEENNLAETAFFVKEESGFSIRWFTPNQEVKLCGHATLASAFVLFTILGHNSDIINFNSLSGVLSVTKKNDLLMLNFPAQPPVSCVISDDLVKGLGRKPVECLQCEDFIAVFNTEEEIKNIKPDHSFLSRLPLRGVIVTAPSETYDFVVRFFAPKYNIPEDPVTGSAYTLLAPYWAERLGKDKLNARQISSRGGNVLCECKADRILISGTAIKYLEGTIEVST